MLTPTILSSGNTTAQFRLPGGAQPLILVPVKVNGEGPFEFILDTGAGTSLLATGLAAQLGLKIIGSKEGQSAGGKVAVSLAKVDSLAVGDTRLADVDVGIVDLSHIGKVVGAKIDGDLGHNFLRYFRVTIDYERSEIRLENPKVFEGVRGSLRKEVKMRLADPAKPLILVEVHANRRGPFQFAIDTGTSTTAITPQLAKELGVTTSPIGPGTTGGAQVAVKAGVLDSFTIGGAKVDDMAVVVGDFFDVLSQAIGTRLDGIVGYNFLRNYKVVLDYPNERLSLL